MQTNPFSHNAPLTDQFSIPVAASERGTACLRCASGSRSGAACSSIGQHELGGGKGELRDGWRLLLGAILGIAIGVSVLPFYTSGLFHSAIAEDFGWSLTQLSIGSMLSTLVLAAVSPLAGILIDRYGVRLPVLLSLFGLAMSYVGIGLFTYHLTTIWALGMVMVVVGAASSPTGYTRAINGHFDKARGMALGIALMGSGATAIIAPPLLAQTIEDFGWRAAYMCTGIAIAILAPIAVALIGRKGHVAVGAAAEAPPETSGERRQLLWQLAAIFFLISFAVAGLIANFVPILMSVGMTRIEGAAYASLIGVAVIAGRLLVGFLVDRFFAPHVAAAALTLCIAGLLLFISLGEHAATIAALAIGLAVGAEIDLIGYLTARYFPLNDYGRYFGKLYGMFLVGTALSPVWIAYIFESAYGYVPTLWIVAALLALAIALLLSLPRFGARDMR